MNGTLERVRLDVLGTSGVVIAADPRCLVAATVAALDVIDAIDAACSRFRVSSDLSRVNAAGGRPVVVVPLLIDAVRVALRAAAVTDGDVDPTVGRALRVLGYDRDFAAVPADGPPVVTVAVARRWREIEVDDDASTVRIPAGVEIDLGATAKALAADRAAAAAVDAVGCGVLVSLGGDIAVAGEPPAGGWPILVDDHHGARLDPDGHLVSISAGGLATSGTSARRWTRGGVRVHHLIDPATSRPALDVWRTVSVAAASCVDANIASTAAMIRGDRAPSWLDDLGLDARLVATDGTETLVGAWGGAPAPTEGATARPSLPR